MPRRQNRNRVARAPILQQIQHQPDHQHCLARTWLTENHKAAGRHPVQHRNKVTAITS